MKPFLLLSTHTSWQPGPMRPLWCSPEMPGLAIFEGHSIHKATRDEGNLRYETDLMLASTSGRWG